MPDKAARRTLEMRYVGLSVRSSPIVAQPAARLPPAPPRRARIVAPLPRCLMNSYTVASASASILAALVLLMQGCTADELDPHEAAYPESIGVTPPRERASLAAGAASANPEPAAPESGGVATAPPASVIIGDDPEGETSYPSADAPGGASVPGPPPAGAPPAEPPPSGAGADEGYGDADPSALTDFRPSLDPYGTWTDDPNYGTVWVPSPDVVGDDFQPYASAGHWAYDDDYVWVSDYDWGWVPFHYGRWAYGPGVGWEWIPGRRYAGAWVSWRYGEGGYGYVGWAPLAPTWGWRGGAAFGLRGVAAAPYAFVGTHDLFSRSIGEHFVSGPLVQQALAHTRPWVAPSIDTRFATGEVRGVGGPPPGRLNIAPASVVRTTAGDRGILQARAFARPSSAVALGGRAPEGSSPRAWQYGGSWRPSTTLGGGNPSHFGGKLGAGFVGNPNAAGPMRSPAILQGRPYYGSPRSGASPYRGFSHGPATSSPVYRSPAAAPRPGGSYSSGGSRGGGGRASGRGGGRR
ncbi:MAG TPA: DUF6600 domain-containing protein [Polyangiaceae bacterium]|nr:DUF6600 domain-containing protein [Polyangiaceae bacterium]